MTFSLLSSSTISVQTLDAFFSTGPKLFFSFPHVPRCIIRIYVEYILLYTRGVYAYYINNMGVILSIYIYHIIICKSFHSPLPRAETRLFFFYEDVRTTIGGLVDLSFQRRFVYYDQL